MPHNMHIINTWKMLCVPVAILLPLLCYASLSCTFVSLGQVFQQTLNLVHKLNINLLILQHTIYNIMLDI